MQEFDAFVSVNVSHSIIPCLLPNRILLTAAPADIPPTLVDQLSSGGRLIAPIGRGEHQQLVILNKSIDGSVDRRTVFPVLFVPMVHPTSKSEI